MEYSISPRAPRHSSDGRGLENTILHGGFVGLCRGNFVDGNYYINLHWESFGLVSVHSLLSLGLRVCFGLGLHRIPSLLGGG